MDMHPLYGKRKKKKKKCANPLFSQWLTEWQEAAAEKGMKSQYTYGKALKALKKFPLRLETGKDCKILENFGDKICKMLDERLAEHVAKHGTTEPVEDEQEDEYDLQPRVQTASTAAKHGNKGAAVVDKQPARVVERRAHDISDDEDVEPQCPAQKRARRGSGADYVPALRSGPYAILISLYRHSQADAAVAYLTKAELIKKAQPLADKSFTMPDPGSRYTAWSSMGTLIKKGLVMKESSPARYSLTDTGLTLAAKLEACGDEERQESDLPAGIFGLGNNEHHRDRNIPHTADNHSMHDGVVLEQFREENIDIAAGTKGVNADPISRLKTGTQAERAGFRFKQVTSVVSTDVQKPAAGYDRDQAPSRGSTFLDADGMSDYGVFEEATGATDHLRNTYNPSSNRLRYWYVDDAGSFVREKDRAVVTVDDVLGVGFLVRCRQGDLELSGKTYLLDDTRRAEGDYVYAYLSNADSEDVAVTPCENSGQIQTSCLKSSRDSTGSAPDLLKHKTCTASIFPSVVNPSSKVPSSHLSFQNKSDTNAINTLREPSVTSQWKFKKTSSISSVAVTEEMESCSQSSVQSAQSVASIRSLSSLDSCSSASGPVADFVLHPGQFDIVLCVDNAEFYGSQKGGSKTLLGDLVKNGIDCDLRKLHVGDLLWVARERVQQQIGQIERPAARELVLPYVIERKRMDDLVSSCIDGRFKEQKFRLKKCGLPRPMYLIEDYSSLQHFSLPETTIKQTIVNIQVVDGFTVRRTKGSKETVAFLTIFTRFLQATYRDKTLHARSLEECKGESFNKDQAHQKLPTFEEFNQGSVKSKALRVDEMLGKQLIQLHGMSAEKASAVIQAYPTPQHLLEGYGRCSTDKQRETMLAGIKCGKTARSLGQAQSKQIYQLYNTPTLT